MSSRGGVPSFVVGAIAGAVFSAAVICLYQNTLTKRRVVFYGSNRNKNKNNETARTTPPVAEKTRMDSCELDQRMIRKAEGAILNRTSRLIVVVERCTNDHNYSAILRTVEALGVQNVYIIAPQCVQSTLTINEDDKKIDDVKVVERKRSSGQPVRRATESEIKDRALHHLYAKKATEWLTVTGK